MTNVARSEHSQMTMAAISSGVPKRPIGSCLMIARATFGSRFIQCSTGGVRTHPGHTALMRMPRETYSKAADFVKPMTPCLAAEYAEPSGNGYARIPSTEELLTITPAPPLSIAMISYFMHNHTLLR